jgi:hypothetical protein
LLMLLRDRHGALREGRHRMQLQGRATTLGTSEATGLTRYVL